MMDRKVFLSSIGTAAAALGLDKFSPLALDPGDHVVAKQPAYLKKGDTIGITSPAGYTTAEEITAAERIMRGWGFNIKHGSTIGKRDFTFGGTDDERAADFQQMLDDPGIKAIMCARGGYGAVRIIDRLRFDKFVKRPKWIIGFSDITVMHAHIYRKYGIHSIHSKMCNSFPDDLLTSDQVMNETIDSIRKILMGEKMVYTAPSNLNNKPGSGTGPVVGGNLKLLETLAGTPSDLQTTGKILFVEDTGEYMYNIDRMFWNLKRSNKLAGLKGLLIGGFKVKIDPGSDDFGRSIYDVVTEKVKNYNFPVCFDFPVGHIRNNYAIRHGAIHKLVVTTNGAELT